MAAAGQGGRSGGGGGGSGAGGGSSCGTGSGRSGLLDKVRTQFWGTVQASGGRGGGEPAFPSPPPFSSEVSRGGVLVRHTMGTPRALTARSLQTRALSSSGLLSFSGVLLVLNAGHHSFLGSPDYLHVSTRPSLFLGGGGAPVPCAHFTDGEN